MAHHPDAQDPGAHHTDALAESRLKARNPERRVAPIDPKWLAQPALIPIGSAPV
jgi:hypothetical protein